MLALASHLLPSTELFMFTETQTDTHRHTQDAPQQSPKTTTYYLVQHVVAVLHQQDQRMTRQTRRGEEGGVPKLVMPTWSRNGAS